MINLLYAALGTLGFGMVFKTDKNKWLYIFIGGFLNYLAYFLVYSYTSDVFLSSMVCALVTSTYSLFMAIILKCPSTIFILTGLIPIVPGKNLFYTMQGLVTSNYAFARENLILTVLVILGIVSGMAMFTVIHTISREVISAIKRRVK